MNTLLTILVTYAVCEGLCHLWVACGHYLLVNDAYRQRVAREAAEERSAAWVDGLLKKMELPTR